jgi:hypothetical protein
VIPKSLTPLTTPRWPRSSRPGSTLRGDHTSIVAMVTVAQKFVRHTVHAGWPQRWLNTANDAFERPTADVKKGRGGEVGSPFGPPTWRPPAWLRVPVAIIERFFGCALRVQFPPPPLMAFVRIRKCLSLLNLRRLTCDSGRGQVTRSPSGYSTGDFHRRHIAKNDLRRCNLQSF